MSIPYLLDNPNEIVLVSDDKNSGKVGTLNVNTIPVTKNGELIEESEETMIEDPNEMLGKDIYFTINIE